jgi:hypothetical protein
MVYLNLVYREKLEEVALNYNSTWSFFDAHSSDTAPPENIIWPISKSPRMSGFSGL